MDLPNDLAERAMRSGRRVGLVVGYLAGGQERVVGYGRIRRGTSEAPDASTLFEIGSITKVFTGVLLADLAEQGVVGLDDPVAGYLPVPAPAFQGRAITLGDLASHAAGLPRNPRGMLGRWLRERRNPLVGLPVEELYAGLARTRLRRPPGQRVRYSNLGAGLLGLALAAAAGQPYEQLVGERICRPLGMPDTVITPSEEQVTRLATGHSRRGKPVAPIELPALAAAGALRSTVADLLRFLRANLDPASTPLAAPLQASQRPRVQAGRRLQVGLGWHLVRPPGEVEALLWHNGGTSGFRSFVGAVRDRGTAVVVLSNSARSVDRLGLRLVKELAASTG